jgi:hypothetical protein
MTVRKRKIQWDSLPLFATEMEIGAALLGAERACEWKSIVPLYERQGMPKIDPVTGGRYTPAVRAFFDRQYNLTKEAPLSPDGIERPQAWTNARKRRA